MERTKLKELTDKNLSTRAIAEQTGMSQTNISYWLKKHGLKTTPSSATNGACILCSKPARSEKSTLCGYCHVKVRRVRVKLAAVAYKGGICVGCGWNKEPRAFHFHHRDASKKEYQISGSSHNKNWEDLKKELDKCDLLCPLCHEVLHTDFSDKLTALVYDYKGNNAFFSKVFKPQLLSTSYP